VWGTGAPRREFLAVDDLADACVFLMKHYSDAGFVNVGSGEEITIADLARLVDGDLPERHDPDTHLIPLAIDAATGDGAPLSILGTDYPTADGTCERDFMHVCDLAAAHVEALRHLNSGHASLTLNLGTGKAASVRSIIAAVERITGRAVPLVHAARRRGDPPMLVAAPRWRASSSPLHRASPISIASSRPRGKRA
jgi:UDP-glucose 4-epimerase